MQYEPRFHCFRIFVTISFDNVLKYGRHPGSSIWIITQVALIRSKFLEISSFRHKYIRSTLHLLYGRRKETYHWLTKVAVSFPRRTIGIATRLRAGRPMNLHSIPGRGKRFFFTPWRPDRLWGPPSLLYAMGMGGCFPGDKAIGAWSWPLSYIWTGIRKLSSDPSISKPIFLLKCKLSLEPVWIFYFLQFWFKALYFCSSDKHYN
jgi:hypothetical protein